MVHESHHPEALSRGPALRKAVNILKGAAQPQSEQLFWTQNVMCKNLGFENQQKQAKSSSFYTSSPRVSNVLSRCRLPLSKNPHPCQSNPDIARWMSSGRRGLTPRGRSSGAGPAGLSHHLRPDLGPPPHRHAGQGGPPVQDKDGQAQNQHGGGGTPAWHRSTSPGASISRAKPPGTRCHESLSRVPALRSEAKAQKDQASPSSNITQLEGQGQELARSVRAPHLLPHSKKSLYLFRKHSVSMTTQH